MGIGFEIEGLGFLREQGGAPWLGFKRKRYRRC